MHAHQRAIAIYKSPTGTVDVRLDGDTVWLGLQQIADLFGRDKSVISRHLRNVFNEGELERPSVVAKNATTAADGKTYQVEFFNLDAIWATGSTPAKAHAFANGPPACCASTSRWVHRQPGAARLSHRPVCPRPWRRPGRAAGQPRPLHVAAPTYAPSAFAMAVAAMSSCSRSINKSTVACPPLLCATAWFSAHMWMPFSALNSSSRWDFRSCDVCGAPFSAAIAMLYWCGVQNPSAVDLYPVSATILRVYWAMVSCFMFRVAGCRPWRKRLWASAASRTMRWAAVCHRVTSDQAQPQAQAQQRHCLAAAGQRCAHPAAGRGSGCRGGKWPGCC